MKYVPELEEERFQSMVAVPILARDGDVIGVVVLHTEAPREFDDDVLNFLVHTASLVGGAIENAQLYEETRRRVDALTTLTQLSQSLAGGDAARGPLRRGHARRAPAARRGRLPDLAPGRRCRRAGAGRVGSRRTRGRLAPGRAALLLDLMRRESGGTTGPQRPTTTGSWSRRWWPATSSSASSAAWSAARRFAEATRSCCRAVANQTAVGLKKAELIERLTAENIVKDMFDALAAGAVADGRGQGGRRALRPQPPARVHPRRARARQRRTALPWPELAARVQARLERLYPRAFFDARHDGLRGLVPLPTDDPARRRALASRATSSPARRVWTSAERRRPRRGERAAPHARGGRRGEHRRARWRPTGAPSPTSSSAPTATWCISSSTRRRTTATGRPSRS